jgi:type III pantothenate kinase
MNVIAIDIGNTNIVIALFLDNKEHFIETVSGQEMEKLSGILKSAWEKIPIAKSSKEKRRDGVIVVSSVKPGWTEEIAKIVKENFDEKMRVIGKDVPLPMNLWVDEPEKVGTDRVVSAAAAYDVVGDAVVVADFGTAVTIDLVDQNGIFLGGVICPGFEICAKALRDYTAQLPNIKVTRPKGPYGKNTVDAINCGLYYSIIGTLQEVVRRYADDLGRWPQTIITGSGAKTIYSDCDFVDDYVPNLVVKGVFLAYKKYVETMQEAT